MQDTCSSDRARLLNLGISGHYWTGTESEHTQTRTLRAEGSSDRAASMSSSESYTLAGPSNTSPSLPVILATHPSGARLPYKICRTQPRPQMKTEQQLCCSHCVL